MGLLFSGPHQRQKKKPKPKTKNKKQKKKQQTNKQTKQNPTTNKTKQNKTKQNEKSLKLLGQRGPSGIPGGVAEVFLFLFCFVLFCFALHVLKPLKCFGSTKMEIFTGEKAFHAGKNATEGPIVSC